MTTHISITCDGCEKSLKIKYPDYREIDLYSYNWHENEDSDDKHYCNQCWQKLAVEKINKKLKLEKEK